MAIGILDWLNETGLNHYPLSKNIGATNTILDANFIQFDNFSPVLKTVEVLFDEMNLTIQFDLEDVVVNVLRSGFTDGQISTVYATSGRFLGKLVFGLGMLTLWNEKVNQTLTVNAAFMPVTVRSIPSSAGLYSIDDVSGDVVLNFDSNVFDSIASQTVTLNAVGISTPGATPALKTINGISPINNNFYTQDSDVLKVIASSSTSLTFGTGSSDITAVASVIPAT